MDSDSIQDEPSKMAMPLQAQLDRLSGDSAADQLRAVRELGELGPAACSAVPALREALARTQAAMAARERELQDAVARYGDGAGYQAVQLAAYMQQDCDLIYEKYRPQTELNEAIRVALAKMAKV